MNSFFKKIWAFLAVLILASIPAMHARQTQTFLYLFYDGSRAGERNQVLGVASALKKYLPENTVRKEFDFKDKEAFLSDVRNSFKENSKNKGIIVAAEVGSIDALAQLGPQPNMIIAHSSHQYTRDHKNLKNVANIVTLPQYVVTPEIRDAIESSHTQLIQTAGVPHNLSPEIVQQEYESHKDSLPTAKKYLGVILGGDAEMPDQKLLYYTAAEAAQMADYLAPQVRGKKAHLFILNGPRTGKHNQVTGELITTSHRDGTIDFVTAAFVDRLEKRGLKAGQDFTLLDFQFGKPSAYPVFLGVLSVTKSPIFVAGESTSMVSETADCLPAGLVTAYTNGAMNDNHRKHCASERTAGRINILENQDGSWRLLKVAAANQSKDSSQPASHIIAQAIAKRFKGEPLA